MRILIITDDELTEQGQRTSLEHLGMEDVKESQATPKLYDSQGVARVCDTVIVARKLEGQKYYTLFTIKRQKNGLGTRGPTPLINLSTIVAGELR